MRTVDATHNGTLHPPEHAGERTRFAPAVEDADRARTVPGWMVVPLRIYFGAAFLYAASNKVGPVKWGQWPGAMQGFVTSQMPHATAPYRAILSQLILPHITLWAPLVAVTEILVGLALLAGSLTRVAAAIGIALTLNYFLLKGTSPLDVSNDLAFIVGLAVVIITEAGRTAGIEGWRQVRAFVRGAPPPS